MSTMRAMLGAALVVATFGVAMAKLPPPPPMTEAQKATADAAKAKAAANAGIAKQQDASAQDRVVARYMAEMKAKGKTMPAAPMAAVAPAEK